MRILYFEVVSLDGKEFGSYLKTLRTQKKLTARQLDLYSGVSHSYISQMERGARGIPSPDILKKLAKPLGVDYEELMMKAGYFDLGDDRLEDLLYKAYKFIFQFIQDEDYSERLIQNAKENDFGEESIKAFKELSEMKDIDEFYNKLEFSNKVGLLHSVFDILMDMKGQQIKSEEEINNEISDKYSSLTVKKREMVDSMIDMLYSDQ